MRKFSWVVFVTIAALLALSGCTQPAAETSVSTQSAEQTPLPEISATPELSASMEPTATPELSASTEPAPEVMEMTPGVSYMLDSDADGVEENVTLYQIDGETTEVQLSVLGGGDETYSAEDGYFVSAYYVNFGSGSACVLLSMDWASDDWYTVVYRMDGNATPEKTDEMRGYVDGIDGVTITAASYIDALGTYLSQCEFTLGKDLTLSPAGDGLWQMKDNNQYITTTAEVPVELLTNGAYADGTLAPGTSIRITASDAMTVAYFVEQDGTEGRVYYTNEEGLIYIDGVQDWDCFETLPYSG